MQFYFTESLPIFIKKMTNNRKLKVLIIVKSNSGLKYNIPETNIRMFRRFQMKMAIQEDPELTSSWEQTETTAMYGPNPKNWLSNSYASGGLEPPPPLLE